MMGEYEENVFEPAAEVFEPPIDIPEGMYEPIERPCVDQLGFVAVCAACPLLRMFGECPKEIREQAPRIDELGVEDELAAFSVLPATPYDIANMLNSDLGNEEIMSESTDVTMPNVGRPVEPESPTRVRPKIERRREKQNGNREYTDIIAPPPKRRKAAKQEEFVTPNFRALLFDDTVPIVTSFSSQPKNLSIVKNTPFAIKEDMSYRAPVHEVPPASIEHAPQALEDRQKQTIEVDSTIPDTIVTYTPEVLASIEPTTVAVDAQPKSSNPPVLKDILHTSTVTPLTEFRNEVPRDIPVAIPTKTIDAAVPVAASVQHIEPLPRANDSSTETIPHIDDALLPIDTSVRTIANAPLTSYEDEHELVQTTELVAAKSLDEEVSETTAVIHDYQEVRPTEELEEKNDATVATPERLTKLIKKDTRTHKRAAHFALGFFALLVLVKQPTAQ